MQGSQVETHIHSGQLDLPASTAIRNVGLIESGKAHDSRNPSLPMVVGFSPTSGKTEPAACTIIVLW